MTRPAPTRLPTSVVLAFGVAWLVLAIVVGAAGLVTKLRPPVPQLILFGLSAVLILLGISLPRLRAWFVWVDLRAVVALHLTRLVDPGLWYLFGIFGVFVTW